MYIFIIVRFDSSRSWPAGMSVWPIAPLHEQKLVWQRLASSQSRFCGCLIRCDCHFIHCKFATTIVHWMQMICNLFSILTRKFMLASYVAETTRTHVHRLAAGACAGAVHWNESRKPTKLSVVVRPNGNTINSNGNYVLQIFGIGQARSGSRITNTFCTK